MDYFEMRLTNVELPPGFELPFKILEERASGFSREELEEKIQYARERSDHYRRMLSLDLLPAEIKHFSSCCKYHVNRLQIYEIALSRIQAEKL